MRVGGGHGDLEPAEEIDRDQGRDVGDGVVRAGDEFARSEVPIELVEELEGARLAALDQGYSSGVRAKPAFTGFHSM